MKSSKDVSYAAMPVRVGVVALLCCIGISVYLGLRYLQVQDELAKTSARLERLEAAVKQREAADPLQARECVELGLGGSRDKPCMTTLRRLAQTPQQFHDRWVMVEGFHGSGFEHSALYPVQPELAYSAKIFDKNAALWVDLDLPNTYEKDMPLVTVIGKFERGPAGHLGDYFGELTDAKLLRLAPFTR